MVFSEREGGYFLTVGLYGRRVSVRSKSSNRSSDLVWKPPATKHLYLLLCAILFLSGTMIPVTWSPVSAAGCYGSTCTGLNPNTMGCDADATTAGSYTYSGGNKVENRQSVACDAEWERTTNLSGGYRYAAGSIRYGPDFAYHQSISSPGMIAHGQKVYTPMKGPDSSTLTLACGKLSTSGVIPLPVTSNCVGPY